MNLTNQQGVCPGVYLVRFDEAIFTGGAVQYQQLVNDTGGSPTGWMDFVSCCLESSATPLLDLQSDPAMTGYFPGLEQVVIRDYMMADELRPHFGVAPCKDYPNGHECASATPIVSINCSQPSLPNQTLEPGGTPGCKFNGLSIESAGFPPGAPAVRVYNGSVQGTTIVAAQGGVYSGQGVVDVQGKPIGIWKSTHAAGWLMSGPKDADALAFLPSGADKPSRIIRADGSEAHHRPGAPAEEAPTVVQSQLSNASLWDPPPLEPGTRATLVIQVAGAEPGDIVASAHSALTMGLGLQLSAICDSEQVEAMLFNSGDEAVDVPAGQLRVVVTKMLWPQLKMDDVGTGGDSGLACVDDFRASMGVTTHWQTPVLPLPGELDMLASAGFSFVRTDMLWSQVERTPGVCECRTGRIGL